MYYVNDSISDADLTIIIKPATDEIIILQVRELGNSRCVKLYIKGHSLPSHVKVGPFRQVVQPSVPKSRFSAGTFRGYGTLVWIAQMRPCAQDALGCTAPAQVS